MKERVLNVLERLKNECSVNYQVTESGDTYLDIVLKTDVLTKYHLFILNELDNYFDYSIYPVNEYKFQLSVY